MEEIRKFKLYSLICAVSNIVCVLIILFVLAICFGLEPLLLLYVATLLMPTGNIIACIILLLKHPTRKRKIKYGDYKIALSLTRISLSIPIIIIVSVIGFVLGFIQLIFGVATIVTDLVPIIAVVFWLILITIPFDLQDSK